jgi:hypothetical protein
MTQYCELTGLAVPGACGIGILTGCGGVSSRVTIYLAKWRDKVGDRGIRREDR